MFQFRNNDGDDGSFFCPELLLFISADPVEEECVRAVCKIGRRDNARLMVRIGFLVLVCVCVCVKVFGAKFQLNCRENFWEGGTRSECVCRVCRLQRTAG